MGEVADTEIGVWMLVHDLTMPHALRKPPRYRLFSREMYNKFMELRKLTNEALAKSFGGVPPERLG